MNTLLDIYNKVNTYGNVRNMEFKVETPGHITYTFPLNKSEESSPGVIHGGSVAGFMDAVMGVAALSLATESGNLVSTVEFKLNFLAPVYSSDVLKGEGKVIFSGKRIYVTEGKIWNQDDVLISMATGTFNAYPAEKSAVKHLLDAHLPK